jgi:hypothetical protein
MAAATIAVLWAATTVALLVAYRPGGPIDPAVAVGPLIATLASTAAVAWPPVARDRSAASALAWVGILTILVLAPSLANLLGTLPAPGTRGGGFSAFLPSPEAAYGWLIALGGTGVFCGIGIARHFLAAPGLRGPRLALGAVIAVALVGVSAGVSGAAALANELAIQASPQASEWGPTDPAAIPPLCTAPVRAGETARVSIDAALVVDEQVVRQADLDGVRSGRDETWEGSTGAWLGQDDPRAPGSPAAPADRSAWIAVGDRAWIRAGAGRAWVAVDRATTGPTLDTALVDGILAERGHLAAEDLGIELIGVAPARHCRLLVDGPAALRAFAPLEWLAGPEAQDVLIGSWRGDLDWWVFTDGELGLARVRVGGPVLAGWPVSGMQAVLQATLSATDRTAPQEIRPPEGVSE